ncbi:hypothetical protein Ciccas_013186 [Cichlidogyrus casuarinus]|uniref:Transketolase-like pyrimidine-binding domain-containing protein n=1 Tax=Cichlidogyrus casuarinus TaxID=1844966 RepID=A0ABD2PLS9_9PLAT
MEAAKNELAIDWACGEALAVSSLLSKGHHVRICGQDVGRGTFSHRHFMLVDQNNDSIYVPMNDESHAWPGRLEVVNSPLSEAAVLGFEIGFATDDPRRLVIWEAQFGDFFNAAQVQIDTYVGSSEAKWYQQNGLVINLPHGYDGAGPEHSSCRLERWLQMTDSIEAPITSPLENCESTAKAPQHSTLMADTDACNLHICAPTTPAQYFHLLRRQILRPFRRPLLVVAPKTMLRLPAARNCLQDFAPGTHFRHVIADVKSVDLDHVTEVIMCSGKHYYALKEYMESEQFPAEKRRRCAILRLEQLTPFPISDLHEELKKYKKAKRFVWSQEEHRNMGAWNFVSRRIKNYLGIDLCYAGRMELATPAVGIGQLHKAEIAQVLKQTFF